jgi:nitrogen fixation/metabolism regulation signal transduction histidine kinase
VAVAALLTIVIGFAAVRLYLRLRRGKFGSRLLIKLAGIFALVGLLPGLTIYTVSYQFVSRSIEAWFDVRLAGALDAGLSLGKGTLDAMTADLTSKARLGADRLADVSPGGHGRDAAGTGAAARADRRHRAGAGRWQWPGAADGRQRCGVAGARAAQRGDAAPGAQHGPASSQVDGLDEEALASPGPGARVRALARVPSRDLALARSEDRFLLLVQPLSRTLALNALAVQAAYSEYQQRALARDSLRRMYIGTLTLALILAVFGAVLLAILLGTQLARPLLLLADGVRQVAAGDLTAKPVFASRDELGGLTRSFADMTAQLAEAREQVQRGVAQLEGARTRLQTILDTLSAGVIVLDRDGRIDTVNPGATRILRLPFAAWRGRGWTRWPSWRCWPQHRPALRAAAHQPRGRRARPLAGKLRAGARRRHRHQPAGARRPPAGRHAAAGLRRHHRRGVGAAQRRLGRGGAPPGARDQEPADADPAVGRAAAAQAGGQARRHRPEPAAAQRGHHRQPGAGDAEAGQRVPRLRPAAGRADEAAGPEPAGAGGAGAVRARAGQRRAVGAARARAAAHQGDATQLRQVIHNLVQNALDAVSDQDHGHVVVRTSSAVGDHGELRAVRLTVIDNGPGFAEKVLQRAFEPYVTTKAKGTGLGLAVVKKIADEHRARLRVVNLHQGDEPEAAVIGARVSLSFSNFAPAADAVPAAPSGGATQVH